MRKRKTFDSVGFMRSVRDRMSKEMSGMTPQEEMEYIRMKSARLAAKRKPAAPGRR